MSVTQIFKGQSDKHVHGIQVKPEPAAPQTLEQRVAAIEQLISAESGKTVLELLADAQAKKAAVDAPAVEAAAPAAADEAQSAS